MLVWTKDYFIVDQVLEGFFKLKWIFMNCSTSLYKAKNDILVANLPFWVFTVVETVQLCPKWPHEQMTRVPNLSSFKEKHHLDSKTKSLVWKAISSLLKRQILRIPESKPSERLRDGKQDGPTLAKILIWPWAKRSLIYLWCFSDLTQLFKMSLFQ